MQRHECNKQLFIYLNNFLEFYFLTKIRVLHNGSNNSTGSRCYSRLIHVNSLRNWNGLKHFRWHSTSLSRFSMIPDNSSWLSHSRTVRLSRCFCCASICITTFYTCCTYGAHTYRTYSCVYTRSNNS
jgi:hypothetical protein